MADDAAVEIGVSEFKQRCLGLLEAMRQHGGAYVITKRGTPIARVTAIRQAHGPLRGALRGRATIQGDIVEVDWSDDWEAAS